MQYNTSNAITLYGAVQYITILCYQQLLRVPGVPRVNADGWNEMLVEAMRKRDAKDQAEGKQTWFMWQFAMKEV